MRCRTAIGVEAHSTLRNKAAEATAFLPPHPQPRSQPLMCDPQGRSNLSRLMSALPQHCADKLERPQVFALRHPLEKARERH